MNAYPENFKNLLVEETKRRIIEESVPRIKKCLSKLSVEEIWRHPNQETVSVGNLVLHLCGNVSQWILAGLGNFPDTRERDREFSEAGGISTERLIKDMDDLMLKVTEVLDQLSPDDLLKKKRVQGFEETGIAILIHVTEHFSYHTGQITYYVKANKNIDMNYYGGIDLNKK
ncbi:DinB family protein [Fulvivirgaceae bacterium BMA12]|uniref:DinB family protein n=1 Tax=Agaribacillus aureus TaxID=3051825 RepID=A0ABT8LEL0_9BACT|nr:DinB family protein [Fulvivirgaceae bacterium BMA12]